MQANNHKQPPSYSVLVGTHKMQDVHPRRQIHHLENGSRRPSCQPPPIYSLQEVAPKGPQRATKRIQSLYSLRGKSMVRISLHCGARSIFPCMPTGCVQDDWDAISPWTYISKGLAALCVLFACKPNKNFYFGLRACTTSGWQVKEGLELDVV